MLLCQSVKWTFNTERSINTKTLQQFLSSFNYEIEEQVELLKEPLVPLQRITLNSLISSAVHQRDLVSSLKLVTSLAQFEWMSQIRFYFENNSSFQKSKFKVKILNSEAYYGNEYLGNTSRIVISDLTERCHKALLNAYSLNYGSLIEGSPAAGKTETIKELSK